MTKKKTKKRTAAPKKKRKKGTKAKKKAKKVSVIKCPHCGNEDVGQMFYADWIPSQRRILDFKDGKLTVTSESEEFDEEAKDAHIFCDGTGCCESFDLPAKIEVEFE